MKNYVSISGVSDNDELREIRKIYRKEGISFPLVIGYQVSHKSINEKVNNPRQPRFINLGGLCKTTLEYGFSPAIHYYTKDNDTIIDDLKKIKKAGVNPFSSLLQLNTLPLQRSILEKIDEMGFNIIFQVAVANKKTPEGGYAAWKGEAVQDVGSGKIAPLVKQVRDRKDFISYIMFDPSHGTNLDLVLDGKSMAIRFGKAVIKDSSLGKIGLVYAGGINPGNVARIKKTLDSFFSDRVSIDSESGLRTTDNLLDMAAVREYLVNSQKATS